jgi:sulfite exporter TauE/SafE
MNAALLLSTLVMGFMGSVHCASMCGPISCSFKGGKQFKSYHLGRLVSYLGIGSLLFFGSQYFTGAESRSLKILFSILFAIFFVIFGLVQLGVINYKSNFKVYKYQFALMSKMRPLINRFPVMLGFLTGLFPCAWLYSFLFLAVQAKSYSLSMSIIFIFWMTSLPAFYLLGTLLQTLIRNSKWSYQKISGFVLIAAGLLSILGHWSDVILLKL